MKSPRLVAREGLASRKLWLVLSVLLLCGALVSGFAACDPDSDHASTQATSTSAASVATPTAVLPTATSISAPTSTPTSHALAMTFSVTVDVVDCPTSQPTGTLCIKVNGSGTSSALGTLKVSRSAVLSPPGDDSCGPSTTTGTLTAANGDAATFKGTGQFCRSTSTATYTYTITGGTGHYARATGTGAVELPRLTDNPSPHETWNGTLIPGA